MALFTDPSIVTLDDLLQFEASLAQTASSHAINVDTKISLALTNVGSKLQQWLMSVGTSDPQWLVRRSVGLSTVVITPDLRRWICFEALTRFFAEAYNTQLNTRFQGKWIECQKEAADALTSFYLSGIGIVYAPLPKPLLPLLSVQDGSADAEAIFVRTSWVASTGDEGALSPINGQVLSGAAGIAVAMAEGLSNAPTTASGWNVYASSSQSGLTLQNAAPLSIGSTWQLPTSGLIAGNMPVGGQEPDFYVTMSRQIRRG